MLVKLKEDIDIAWDEASELVESMGGFNDEELVENRDALEKRAQRIVECLYKYAEWKGDG